MEDLESANAYVLLIAKKVRALRKKLEKVKAMEGQHDLGKELNEEQRVLLNSKTTLERSLKEHESLKVQIEEIARDEQAHSGASHADDGEIEPPEPAPARPDEKSNGHHTPTVAVPIIHEQTTQTDPELPPPPPPPPPPVRAVPEENGARLFEEGESPDHKSIELLLKLLHVVGRYEGQTGATLPSEVDYMGKVVLGKTSLPEDNFFDALAQSVNDAVLYLERGEHSNMPVANGKTYKQLRELVDKLADSLCQPPTPTKTTAPQSPQLKINFFADPTAALDDMGEADLTLALDSMSEANVDALTSSVEPNAVHQAITVDDTVEIAAAGPRPTARRAPRSTSAEQRNAELLNAIVLEPSAIMTNPMPLAQEMVIGVPAEGEVADPIAWMPPVSAMAALPEGPGTEKMAANARKPRRSRGRGTR